jgi:chorismate lyase
MRRMEADQLVDVPEECALVEPPYMQRQVYLQACQPSSPPLVYAVSWWNADTVREYLKDASMPIWASLSRERTELFRDIRSVYYGQCPALEDIFKVEGPFWGRDYVFWHQGKPLTVIHEVFSTALSEYLGPSQGATAELGACNFQRDLQVGTDLQAEYI